ncbi:hypothetical protein NL108_015067, partial [Boleophthalmus pectinirostris]
MLCSRRKRLQVSRVLFLLSGVCLCALYQLTVSARLQAGVTLPQTGLDFGQGSAEGPEENLTEDASPRPSNKTLIHCVYLTPPPPPVTPTPLPAPPEAPSSPSPPGGAPHAQGDYPEDLFSIEERRRGWVLLHILGMMYMFVSLAIVCDEFFVPALGVITDKLAISDDVAGATFMAAGGSAPELFTSLIGVFIAHSNVGIGTIVGSAVFNILFVIGMCALFSREMLHLTWWPLFRDVSFYILDLILLILFFLDNVILWWESLMLVGGYSLYVVFMKYNVQIERFVKGLLHRHKMIVKVIALEEPEKVKNTFVFCSNTNRTREQEAPVLCLKPSLQRGGSSASLHNSTMRNTIFQLMIHTLDPLGDGRILSLCVPLCPSVSLCVTSQCDDVPADGGSEDSDDSSDSDESDDSDESEESEEEEEEGEEEEPLSLEWPDTRRKQVTYLLLLPIVLPLWLTVPDVRNQVKESQRKSFIRVNVLIIITSFILQKSRKFFVMTFLGSIIWIAIFSYLMVWWAHQVGETIGISEEIMGLTILAAGTSIPDLITSVIVARKGLGDMAVSSSVGSNIFDITVG